MDELEALRADLIRRWREAFGRADEVRGEPIGAVTTVTTEVPAFALEGFTAGTLKPGARLSRTQRDSGYTYYCDARGRPVQVRFAHALNGFSWRGIYRYADDEVDHLEVCLETGIPSLYNRLVLSDGLVSAEQRFVCNSGGTRAASATQILDDPHAYSTYITRYTIAGGRPVAAVEHHAVDGKVHRPTRTYTYDPGGALLRIDQHWPGHGQRTLFAAKSKVSTKSLANDLSQRLAVAIIDRLSTLPRTPRLVALELSYREHDSAIPILVPLTETDAIDSLALSAGIPSARWLHLSEEDFAPAITDFMARDGRAVGTMLRTAAKLVTQRARAELEVDASFVAFAIDWELEADALASILKRCGAAPERLRDWRRRGWV